MTLLAEPCDSEFRNVTRLEVTRGIETETNSWRRAGRDDIARKQSHEVAEIGNLRPGGLDIADGFDATIVYQDVDPGMWRHSGAHRLQI